MSKKECKRVPSYAIRHLIQSLKEKGRTCRKGAEQRIDREILICDPEEEYVRRLAEALLLKKEVTAGVRICSSPEMVQELLKIGLIKVLLISEDVPYEKRKQIFTGKRIILTRQHCVDLGEEETELRKYQPVDGLMTGILKGLQEEKFPGSCADNGNGRILGVYSPVHRIGKTTFSLKLGKALAQSEDVLYLNLETYAGMGGYFRDQDAPDLANVLYYAKQERDDIGIRIASMVKRMGDLDYIPPMKVWTDLRAVHTEEWKTLFERLISQSVYSVIILDIGNGMEDVFQLLRLCDQILICSTYGHTLVLFTSYSLMGSVYQILRDSLPFPMVEVWRNAQEEIMRFKTLENAVLFAAGSCWEGVDFPGDIVSSLIIVRLPFAVPDPLREAEKERYATLPEYIRDIIVPDMQKKLRQGFGRAIRTESDTCVVSILDHRAVAGGRYHEDVLCALPACQMAESIEDVEAFIRRQKQEGYYM